MFFFLLYSSNVQISQASKNLWTHFLVCHRPDGLKFMSVRCMSDSGISLWAPVSQSRRHQSWSPVNGRLAAINRAWLQCTVPCKGVFRPREAWKQNPADTNNVCGTLWTGPHCRVVYCTCYMPVFKPQFRHGRTDLSKSPGARVFCGAPVEFTGFLS